MEKEMQKLLISANPPKYRLQAREHFWVKGLKNPFDLSGLMPLYLYVQKNHNEIIEDYDYDFTIGSATIVFSVRGTVISLITGWVGNRINK